LACRRGVCSKSPTGPRGENTDRKTAARTIIPGAS
jgi:hypothetical protein